MKYCAPLLTIFGLVCLTAPDGFGVWIAREQVVSVAHALECSKASNAKVTLSNGQFLCVLETPQAVLTKLDTK